MTNSGKILVLGPTGNVGSALTPRLTAAGEDVRVLVRDDSKAQALKDAGVEVSSGDLNNLNTLHAAFEGGSKVFLLTTPGPNGGAMASNAIAAAKQSGNPHVVNLSVAKATPSIHLDLGESMARLTAHRSGSGNLNRGISGIAA